MHQEFEGKQKQDAVLCVCVLTFEHEQLSTHPGCITSAGKKKYQKSIGRHNGIYFD